jgi:hypothetical protein
MTDNQSKKNPGQIKAEEHANLAGILLVDAANIEGPRQQELVAEAKNHLNLVESWLSVTPEAPEEARVAVKELTTALNLFERPAAN